MVYVRRRFSSISLNKSSWLVRGRLGVSVTKIIPLESKWLITFLFLIWHGNIVSLCFWAWVLRVGFKQWAFFGYFLVPPTLTHDCSPLLPPARNSSFLLLSTRKLISFANGAFFIFAYDIKRIFILTTFDKFSRDFFNLLSLPVYSILLIKKNGRVGTCRQTRDFIGLPS